MKEVQRVIDVLIVFSLLFPILPPALPVYASSGPSMSEPPQARANPLAVPEAELEASISLTLPALITRDTPSAEAGGSAEIHFQDTLDSRTENFNSLTSTWDKGEESPISGVLLILSPIPVSDEEAPSQELRASGELSEAVEIQPNQGQSRVENATTEQLFPMQKAITKTWDGEVGDGLWQTPANWSNNTLPGGTDGVSIPAGYTVTLSAGTHSIDSLTCQR